MIRGMIVDSQVAEVGYGQADPAWCWVLLAADVPMLLWGSTSLQQPSFNSIACIYGYAGSHLHCILITSVSNQHIRLGLFWPAGRRVQLLPRGKSW